MAKYLLIVLLIFIFGCMKEVIKQPIVNKSTNSTGNVRLNCWCYGYLTGTPAYSLSVDSNGIIIIDTIIKNRRKTTSMPAYGIGKALDFCITTEQGIDTIFVY